MMVKAYNPPFNAFKWMDVMRALAALLVSASHLRDILWRDAHVADGFLWKLFYLATGFGHSGVIVFFVLSGFWITGSVCKKLGSDDFWRPYLIDRLVRLMIVLAPVLFIGAALDYLGLHVLRSATYTGSSGAHSLHLSVEQTFTFSNFFQSLFFLGGITSPPFGSNGPLWSLSFEFWYYIWFPAIALCITRKRMSLALVSFLVIFFSATLLLGFICWLMGSALYFVTRNAQGPSNRLASCCVMLSLVLFLIVFFISRIFHAPWFDPILASSFATLLFFICSKDLRFPPYLDFLAKFGSTSSFSLYALHFPVFMIIAALVSGGNRQDPSLGLILISLASMMLLTLLSLIFSSFTEARTGPVRAYLHKKLC